MKALRLMVLGGGSSQESFLRRAGELGCRVILADQNPKAPGRPFAQEFVQVSTFDVSGVEAAARELAPDVLATVGSDQPVYTCAAVSDRLGIPYSLSPETARATTNKGVMKEALVQASVPTVRHTVVAPDEEPAIGFPRVVKPLDSQGQRGVTLVPEPREYPAAVKAALSYSREGSVLVEEYYPSTEVTVSGWVESGRVEVWSITDRVTFPPEVSLGVCAAHRYPSMHSPRHGETIITYTNSIVSSFGIREGPIYFQFLIGDEGVRANEVACRLGGAYEDESLPTVTGADPLGSQLSLCFRLAGRSLPTPAADRGVSPPGREGAFFAVPLMFCREGSIAAYRGDDALRRLAGVANCRFLLPVGTRILPMRNSTQRVAYAVLAGRSRQSVNALVDTLFDRLAVESDDGTNILLDTRDLCKLPEAQE